MKTVIIIAALALLACSSNAQVLVSSVAGNAYSQNFDTLANSGTANTWTDDSTLKGWYAAKFGGSGGSGPITVYQASTGSGTSGALYSFGSASATDRALGSIGSNTSGDQGYGVRFYNDTSDRLNDFTISYTGEQWRNGGNTTAQKLVFAYRISASPIADPDPGNAATWTAVPELDFTGPVATSTGAALDGNASANRTAISFSLSGVTVEPGEEIFFRWFDDNDAGNDHGLAVDDFGVTYTRSYVPPSGPSITTQPQPVTAAVGMSPSLFAVASGTPILHYRWYKNGSPLTDGGNVVGATSNRIAFTGVFHTNAGNYKVVVSNSVNTATSDEVALTVEGFAIEAIPATNTLSGTPLNLAIRFVDNQSPITLLTAVSGNQTLLPDANIAFSPSGNPRAATLSPSVGNKGVAKITVSASDGTFTTNVAFPLVVVPSSSVVLNDFFDYADASLVFESGNLWQNHGGTLEDLQVVAGQVYLSRSASEDVHAELIGQPYPTNSGLALYATFKVNFSSSDTPTAAGAYFAHFKDAEFGYRGRVWASTNASGNLRLGIGNASNADANSGQYPLDLMYNTPYTVVTKLELATGVSTIWINPTNELDFSVTATDGDPATNGINIVSYALRQNSGMSKLFFDDLVVGTSFEAVTGLTKPAADPIPLTIQKLADGVVLTWTNAGFKLQSASAVAGPYTTLDTATSPHTNSISGEKYFRLKY